MKLRSETETTVQVLGARTGSALEALNHFYRKPIMTASALKELLQVSTPTCNTLLKALVDLGILKELTGQMRHRLYMGTSRNSEFADEVQGARRAGTGVYEWYMRIPSTAQRGNSP